MKNIIRNIAYDSETIAGLESVLNLYISEKEDIKICWEDSKISLIYIASSNVPTILFTMYSPKLDFHQLVVFDNIKIIVLDLLSYIIELTLNV